MNTGGAGVVGGIRWHARRIGGGGLFGGIGRAAGGSTTAAAAGEAEGKTEVQRIRVGGNVQSARLVKQPKPVYPPLARQARIQGTVRFNAIIGKDGTIANLTLVSGHPLLVPAAHAAVKQWVYQPTLLNGEPVEVVTVIDVNFTLSGDRRSDSVVCFSKIYQKFNSQEKEKCFYNCRLGPSCC